MRFVLHLGFWGKRRIGADRGCKVAVHVGLQLRYLFVAGSLLY